MPKGIPGRTGYQAARDTSGHDPFEPVKGEAGGRGADVAIVVDFVHLPTPAPVEEEAVQEVVVAIEQDEIDEKLPSQQPPIDRCTDGQCRDDPQLHESFLQDDGPQPSHRDMHGIQPFPAELRVHCKESRERQGRVVLLVVSDAP